MKLYGKYSNLLSSQTEWVDVDRCVCLVYQKKIPKQYVTCKSPENDIRHECKWALQNDILKRFIIIIIIIYLFIYFIFIILLNIETYGNMKQSRNYQVLR